MNDPVPPQLVCRRCQGAIDATDNYCRHCASPTGKLGGSPAKGSAEWWESPWFVVTLLLFVVGPLALPLLWRSRRFTVHWKIVLTIVVTFITAYFLWVIWYTLNQALAPLQELKNFRGF
jgi:hypothetical protein